MGSLSRLPSVWVKFRLNRSPAGTGTEEIGCLLYLQHDVAVLAEVVRLGMGELAGFREPTIEMIDHDYPRGTDQP